MFAEQAEEICKLCNLVFVNEVSCELHKGGRDHRAVSQAGAAGPQYEVLLEVQPDVGNPDPRMFLGLQDPDPLARDSGSFLFLK